MNFKKLDDYLKTTIYNLDNFDIDQKKQIILGLESGVDVSIYAIPSFHEVVMKPIRIGLELGFPMKGCINSNDVGNKIEEIIITFLEGYKYDSIFLKNASTQLLREMRYTNKICIGEQSIYTHFNKLPSVDEIVKYREKTIHENAILKNKKRREEHLNLGLSILMEYNKEQMRQLLLGHNLKLDVSLYEDPNIPWEMMRQIRLSLIEGQDILKYVAEGYDWEQIRELRRVIRDGLDISLFEDIKISAKEMRRMRNVMKFKDVDPSSYLKDEEHMSDDIEFN